MKTMTLLFPLCLAACGKPSDPTPAPATAATSAPTSEPTAAPEADVAVAAAAEVEVAADAAPTPDVAAAADAAAADAAPAADNAALTQCKTILQKSWAAVKPVIEGLGVTADAALEATYTANENYLKACSELAQDKRDCLEKDDNPVAAITTCEVNKPKRVLWAHDFGDKLNLWPPVALQEGEGDKLLAGLVGKWVSTWDTIKQTQTWVIGEAGAVTSAEVTKDGAPDPKANVPEKISFANADAMQVLWKGSTTTQTLAFFKENDDVFYASTNKLYAAFPVEDAKKFVVRHNWDIIAFDNGKCSAISAIGLAAEAKCTFVDDKGKRVFRAEFLRVGAARPATVEFVVIGKHFLVDSMVTTTRFVRQK